MRLSQQVQPDKIKLLTPQQVAALGPAKVAALADVCVEWGPLSDADRARALAVIEPLDLGKLMSQKKVEIVANYWLFLPPAANKSAADKRVDELKAQGIKEASVVDVGPQRLAISLGAFRTEEAAQNRLAALQAQGVKSAQVGQRVQAVQQTALVIRDPPAPAVVRLKELQSRLSRQRSEDRNVREDQLSSDPVAALPLPRRRRSGRRESPEDIAQAGRCSWNTRNGSKVDLCFQGFDAELAGLPGSYAPPRGRLLLAGDAGPSRSAASRCVRSMPGVATPHLAAHRRGQAPVRAARHSAVNAGVTASRKRCIAEARAIGYRELKLDTLAWMSAARALYAELGFRDCAPYYANPLPEVVYMSLDLAPPPVAR